MARIVTLPDGSQATREFIDKILNELVVVSMMQPRLIHELYKKCQDNNYKLSSEDSRALTDYRFLIPNGALSSIPAGNVWPSNESAVLALVSMDGDTLIIRDIEP